MFPQTTLQVVRNQITKPIPGVGDIVTAKVTKLFTRYAVVDIMCVNSCPLSESYQGKIRFNYPEDQRNIFEYLHNMLYFCRREDVRALDIDSVEIFKSFRPGDIIRASVISLGDAKSYYLSTAQNELGVVLAHSSGGHTMIPLNWLQMQCPITKTIEFRKVAKIVE
jgi:exosome complex component CSL4